MVQIHSNRLVCKIADAQTHTDLNCKHWEWIEKQLILCPVFHSFLFCLSGGALKSLNGFHERYWIFQLAIVVKTWISGFCIWSALLTIQCLLHHYSILANVLDLFYIWFTQSELNVMREKNWVRKNNTKKHVYLFAGCMQKQTMRSV